MMVGKRRAAFDRLKHPIQQNAAQKQNRLKRRLSRDDK